MTVEILCVGTELLLGNIVNTNAAYLARKCAALGLSCNYQTVVGDNESCLARAIECAVKRSDVLMISGGLSLAENIQKKNIKADKTVVMENENGPSRGFLIETEECKIIMLPGSPNELAAMFEKNIIPYLEKLTSGVIYSQTVKICGIEEIEVTERIKDLVENQTNLTVTLYPMTGEVHVRVLAVSEDMKQAKKLIKPVVKELKARFGYNVYTTEEDTTLEKAVVELLIANDLTVTCAESCTGGMLSAKLIDVPGVSEVYKSGLVTYSNKAKRKVLNVKKPTLQKYGAVSRQTAEEMAKGAAAFSKSDVAVAITGIAGPDGGSEEKPVGLVYIACNVKGNVTVKEFHFFGNRTQVRESAVSAALMLMRNCMLEYFSKVTFGN